MYPLGKLPQRKDSRTLDIRKVLKTPADIPASWAYDDVHKHLGAAPVPMFGNDRHGCCVIASQGHLTIRMEGHEHNRYPRISEDEVLSEYYRQSGGADSGLYMLDAANHWRKDGWIADRRREYIDAYGMVPVRDYNAMRTACIGKLGLWIGARLPLTAADQLEAGKPWTVVNWGLWGRSRPGTWGGHAMAIVGYTPWVWYLATWGGIQKASRAWVAKYADEVYAVVDHLDARADVVDVDEVRWFLHDKADVA